MNWYTIEEVIDQTNLSKRSIQRKAKEYNLKARQKGDKECVKYRDNGKATYSENLIKSILKRGDKGTTKGVTNDTPNDALKDDYISHLKEEIKSLREQIKDFSIQFSNFQEIEKEAMARFKEQNHIIMQLEMISEERLQKIERLSSERKVEPNVSEKNETFEEAKEVNPINDEEAVLSDDPEQLPGQTMMPFKEEQIEKDQVEKLSKHRRDILSEKLARGEKEAEERRKRVQELRREK